MGWLFGGRKEIKGTDSCPKCGGVLEGDGMDGTTWLLKCPKCGEKYKKSY